MRMMNHTFLNRDHMVNNPSVQKKLLNIAMLLIYVLYTLKIPKNNRRKSKNMKMYNKYEDYVKQVNEIFQQIIIYTKDVQIIIEIVKILSLVRKV